MSKFKFKVWEPFGTVTVEANSKEEALELAEDFWNTDDNENVRFNPLNDGQEFFINYNTGTEWEIK